LRGLAAQFDAIGSIRLLAQNLASVRTAYHGAQEETTTSLLSIRSYGYLATAAERSQQRALTIDGSMRIGIVQKSQQRFGLLITSSDLNGQRALPDSRTHHVG